MGPYNIITSFTSESEASEFAEKDIQNIRNMKCTCMKLSYEEANSISRKNAVAYAASIGSIEKLNLAEQIFKTKSPL